MGQCIKCSIEVSGKWICSNCSKGYTASDLLRELQQHLFPNNKKAKEFTEEVITELVKRDKL